MNVKKYFERVNNKLDNMTDKEFMKFLDDIGIEECPLKSEVNLTYKMNNDISYNNYRGNITKKSKNNNYTKLINNNECKSKRSIKYTNKTNYNYNLNKNKNFVLKVA